jgi:predicted nucleic acid-binding protein
LKQFFDSSVLIPAFYKFHIHHAPSVQVFLKGSKENSFCALRTLGEVYAVLTGLPVRPRITGHEGIAIVQQILDRLTVVALSEQEYGSALRSISATVIGGAAYDGLIAQCAIKSGANVLLTWNVRDFVRFGPEVARLVKMPLDLWRASE